MSPTIYGNLKMASASLKTSKMRSFLTMLGVIIGVVSVVTVVSIGQGIKQQVGREINQLGPDMITVQPGEPIQRGATDGLNLLYSPSASGSLANEDIATVQKTPGVRQAAPLALVTGTVKANNKEYDNQLVLATTQDMDGLLDKPTEYGEFFIQDDLVDQPDVAVIGHDVAQRLFGERNPLGSSFDYLGQTFFVRGVMKKFDSTPLSLTTDFNDAILIPYSTAQKHTNNNTQLYEILAKPTDSSQLHQVVDSITASLKSAHGGQQRFSVLRQDESLKVTNRIADLMTKLIACIAAVSLLVGGIGIMNVMLVSVAERMHEIGLRKALGASNRQIMAQFMTEATLLSLLGSIIGVVISLAINFILRVTTSLTPVVPWEAIGISVVISVAVGSIFGTIPALKAARKDPIEALRSY